MLVWIIDPAHPHYREYGHWSDEETVMNGLMHLITLNNCEHGNEGCYALRGQVQQVE